MENCIWIFNNLVNINWLVYFLGKVFYDVKFNRVCMVKLYGILIVVYF